MSHDNIHSSVSILRNLSELQASIAEALIHTTNINISLNIDLSIIFSEAIVDSDSPHCKKAYGTFEVI